jgi:drug/metabolite transporter (DMT)-like permease
MIGTMPVMLAVGATIFAHERLNGFGWMALAASSGGAALIILGGKQQSAAHGPALWGDLLVVLSLMIALGWVLVNQRLMKSHGPLVITAYGVLSGTAMLVVWVLLQSGPPPTTTVSTKAWLAIAASGVLCTATTTFLWNWGVHHVPASRAGVFLNIEPALGSFLGVRLLGDKLGSFAWIGGALILGAAVVMTSQHHETNTTLQ